MERIRVMFLAVGFLACFSTPGCNNPQPQMRGLRDVADGYEKQLARWTASGDYFQSFDRVIRVYATYLTDPFRQAMRQQYERVFNIRPQDARIVSDLEEIANSSPKGHEFFFFVDTSEFTWNDLEARDSVWSVVLWNGDEKPAALAQTARSFRGRGPNLKAFFPYVNDFGRAYYVHFPSVRANGRPIPNPEENEIIIKLACIYGEVSLTWKVEP